MPYVLTDEKASWNDSNVRIASYQVDDGHSMAPERYAIVNAPTRGCYCPRLFSCPRSIEEAINDANWWLDNDVYPVKPPLYLFKLKRDGKPARNVSPRIISYECCGATLS